MILEAVENHYREETNQPQIERKGYPIEHLLPRSWSEFWPVDTPEAEEERQARIHRLGNLTLLTNSLNAKVSNGPWASKRAALLGHNTITLTGRVIKRTEHATWNEQLIDERTEDLIEALFQVWPVPEGHQGEVNDPQSKGHGWITLMHLMEAGFMSGGDKLYATHRDFQGEVAVLTEDGMIEVDGIQFSAPSSAAVQIRKRSTNGWYFWALEDGRRLRDVRTEFQRTLGSSNSQTN